MSRRHWEQQASNWSTWARKPGFDAYWKYAPAFFELVPPAQGKTLEVGCGEGRVARDLVQHGHDVVAVDATPELVKLARESDRHSDYLRCDAAALPFEDESFDLAIFYNSLMDVDDMEGSVREAARVLRHGGQMCACVTHPMADAGHFHSRAPDAPFVIEGTYLGPRRWLQVAIESEGVTMDFAGWAYTLEAYFRALEQAGLMVEALREPAYPLLDEGKQRWRRIPNFLMWRAVKS